MYRHFFDDHHRMKLDTYRKKFNLDEEYEISVTVDMAAYRGGKVTSKNSEMHDAKGEKEESMSTKTESVDPKETTGNNVSELDKLIDDFSDEVMKSPTYLGTANSQLQTGTAQDNVSVSTGVEGGEEETSSSDDVSLPPQQPMKSLSIKLKRMEDLEPESLLNESSLCQADVGSDDVDEDSKKSDAAIAKLLNEDMAGLVTSSILFC